MESNKMVETGKNAQGRSAPKQYIYTYNIVPWKIEL
jgi:hypothetical protein